ncbi:MAG: hypothetical protein HOE14_06330 [Gemmatimonadales bacterium]|nr:hypothetical protein [Gemmatimonadales bacterium]
MPALRRSQLFRTFRIGLVLAVGLVVHSDACAQLRPLDPIGWSTFDRPGGVFLMGVAAHVDQRISLAGAHGRLYELGVFQATWSYERVAVRIGGTLYRLFDGQGVYDDPVTGTRAPDGTLREDWGDIRVSTLIWLTNPKDRVSFAFRFGSRLPTTDNKEGLGRDQADFFTTVGVRLRDGPWDLSAEGGAGINGTRDPQHEQIDPILFSGAAVYDAGSVDPFLEFTGQHDPRSERDRRGNENVGEVRVGVQVGGQQWLRIMAARGWTSTSPDLGVTVLFGTRFGGC